MPRRLGALSLLLILALAFRPATAAEKGSFKVKVPVDGVQLALRVFDFVPNGAGPDTPIVFVMHGLGRDAEYYRDTWIGYAKRHGFSLAVPEFTKADFPGGANYNRGNVMAPGDRFNREDQWRFSLIELVFEAARRRFGSRCRHFGIYGHSAGSQFVHRLTLLATQTSMAVGIAANAGVYTMPDFAASWPFGMRNVPDASERLGRAFGRKLVVLLGDADADPFHKYLDRSEGATAQGPHRFARGGHFFARARAEAKRMGVDFNWELDVVPGVAHSNRGMAKVAAPYIARHLNCD
jgi:poly(3-hydroxybutyrate) depolymerase